MRTHLEHVFEGIEVSKKFLYRNLFRVKDKVIPQVIILLLHVLM